SAPHPMDPSSCRTSAGAPRSPPRRRSASPRTIPSAAASASAEAMRPDAVVVGAGIVGAACAAELAAAGLAVTVLESRFAGAGAPAAGMGPLVVMDGSPAELALTRAAVGLWEELAPELPEDVEDEPRGTLWIAAEEAELALVRGKAELYRSHGVA